MRNKLKLTIIAILVFVFAGAATSRVEAQEFKREVNFNYVKINDRKIEPKDFDAVVASPEDTITFHYECKVSGGPKSDILFDIELRYGNDSYDRNWNSPALRYVGLPEDEYLLVIGAFDPRNQWSAEPDSLRFIVDRNLADKMRELQDLRIEVERLAAESANTSETSTPASSQIDKISILFGLIAGIVLITIPWVVTFILTRRKMKKQKERAEEEAKDKVSISQNEYDKIITENSNLRAEISALRGQIDALNSRSSELRQRNKELQETIEQVTAGKSELEELQKQKDDLFAVIIHDIKNPASLVKSLVELLRSYDLNAVEQQEVIDDIVDTTSRIVSLSQEVTKILALEGNKLHLELEKVNFNEVVHDVFKRNTIAAKNKNIDLLFEKNDNLPEVELDPQRVDEVIDNLISNAIKFSEKNAKVRIKTSVADKNIVLEVSDNGQGLSEDDVNKAFRRGAKLSARPTAGESSSGFGLWIVKKLIEAHKGRVWVRSAVGKGSTFAFSIPLTQDK